MKNMMKSWIPVTLITGFLGSGKTTLLNRLVHDPHGQNAAVLINEFGEVGLDHLLATNVAGTKVVINNGCICCTVHEDLQKTLRDLFYAREKGEIAAFDRVLIETSGASDPLPVMMTLRSNPLFTHHFRLDKIITTIDTLTGVHQLKNRAIAQRQAAMADLLILTKTDLLDDTQILDTLHEQLGKIAPEAQVLQHVSAKEIWQNLFNTPNLNVSPSRFVSGSLKADSNLLPFRAVSLHRTGTGLNSFALVFDTQPDWTKFAVWLSLLMHRYGDKILRIKGLLNVAGADKPLVLNAVQNFIHPPVHLDAWPDDDDRRSKLVFITDGMDKQRIAQALRQILDIH